MMVDYKRGTHDLMPNRLEDPCLYETEDGVANHMFYNMFQLDWYRSVIYDKKKNRTTQ